MLKLVRYEIPEELQEDFGCNKYFLSSEILDEYWFNRYSIKQILYIAKDRRYYGYYETENEAYLAAMLVKTSMDFGKLQAWYF